MDFRVPDIEALRERYAEIGSPLGYSPSYFTYCMLWQIQLEMQLGEPQKLSEHLSYGHIGDALRKAGYAGYDGDSSRTPAMVKNAISAAFAYGHPNPEKYISDRWGLYYLLGFDSSYGALEKFVTDETHYMIEREGHSWNELQRRFEGLGDSDYRNVRARVIDAVVRLGIDYFHPETGHNAFNRLDENFRRPLDSWISSEKVAL
ncbi:hypothetical protein HY640_02890 [Candidatus Woesearchaeota archaeon]|nr:hypothetical protein [Candidatus Woesearchaeota archaeon]